MAKAVIRRKNEQDHQSIGIKGKYLFLESPEKGHHILGGPARYACLYACRIVRKHEDYLYLVHYSMLYVRLVTDHDQYRKGVSDHQT